jgi:hypothetical protein
MSGGAVKLGWHANIMCQRIEWYFKTSERLITQEPTFLCVLYGKLVQLATSV